MDGAPLGVRKGAWTEEEDLLLRKCIAKYGEGNWHQIPLRAGLNRCRKSCRLRWLNYLKPDIKRGNFAAEEVDLIIRLHKLLGNRWSLIAGRLPGRTANDVKNYWNTHLQKKLISQGQDDLLKSTIRKENMGVKVFRPQPRTFSSKNLPWLRNKTNNNNIQRNQDNRNNNRPCPTLVLENKEKSWWDDMVLDMEINTADVAWSSGGESITGLWDEKISTVPPEMLMVGDDSSIQQIQIDWGDIFMDNVDLWDLLKDEQTVI